MDSTSGYKYYNKVFYYYLKAQSLYRLKNETILYI